MASIHSALLRRGGRAAIVVSAGIGIGMCGSAGHRAAAQDAPPEPQPSVQMPPVTVQASPWVSQDETTGQKGYITNSTTTSTKTNTPLINIPQSITVLTKDFIKDQDITSIEQGVRYVPGVIPHQGESNRDDLVIRGQRSNADFFLNGIRDDVQYYRDLYNLERLEVLKGPNAMIFGRGGGGGVVNRVTKEADGVQVRNFNIGGNSYPGFRATADYGEALSDSFAFRVNAMYEKSNSYRDFVNLERYAINPTLTWLPDPDTSVKLGLEYLHDWRVTDRGIPSQVRRRSAAAVSLLYVALDPLRQPELQLRHHGRRHRQCRHRARLRKWHLHQELVALRVLRQVLPERISRRSRQPCRRHAAQRVQQRDRSIELLQPD